MVELVDNDVVEVIGRKIPQMSYSPERLDRGEKDVRIEVFLGAVIPPETSSRPASAKRLHGLAEDFLAMGDKQNPREFQAI